MNCPAQPDLRTIAIGYATRCRLVLAVAAVVFGIGCNRPRSISSGVIAQFQIEPTPVRVGGVIVSLMLTDAASHALTGARIAVEADMSHAGMSPVFAQVHEVQPGQYESRLSLPMAGDWVILWHGTLASGEKLERQFDVRGVRPSDVRLK
jgi:hypothetical protein